MARAPLRVSLAGGGTDLPSYARDHGGLVISLAIDRHVGVSVFPREFSGGVRASWEGTEQVLGAAQLGNPYAREVFRRAGVTGPLQVASFSDAPSGTGLGGSGAFTVSLLHALRHARAGGGPQPDGLPHVDRTALAEDAAAVEMTDLGRPVGKHDHYMASYGGLRALYIGRDLSVRPEELPLSRECVEYVNERLLLFYTGLSRDAGTVLEDQANRTARGDSGVLASLDAMRALATNMLEAVRHGRLDDIGPILHEHWTNKVRMSHGITNPRIDVLYRTARAAGAEGGKLLGAGGGGFLLVAVRKGQENAVRAAMREQTARELTFGPDTTGSQAVGLAL
ncbi:hypothetical protein ACFU53_02460 [Streptomyces sp. NPDC057474]|uniref:GHMP family kinase ATP-binding protein n=1 Tax=Streptomyces sp. NPDC057474 TaxID=3346144 RepID=UPI0036B8750F